MSVLVRLNGFCHGSLSTLSGLYISMGFSKLHFEHPGEDLIFISMTEALPQLRGLSVVLLI
jgi:hypothetical protein